MIKLLTGTALASGLLAGATPAFAQTASAPVDAASSNENSKGIEDIVVTARKVGENLQKVPVAVTAFNGAELTRQSALNVRDISAITPSLSFQDTAYDRFSTYVSIRGAAQQDVLLVTEPTVGLYVDGVYQGTSVGIGASGLFDIQRVEVLKGPQGTLYGRNSIGGAIAIYTNEPDYDGLGGNFRLSYANYETVNANAAVNIPIIADTAALRVTTSYYNRNNGIGRNTFTGKDIGQSRLFTTSASLRLDPAPGFKIILRGNYADGFDSGAISKLLGIQTTSPGTIVAALTGAVPAASAPNVFALFNPAATPAQLGAAFATLGEARANLLASVPTKDYDVSLSYETPTYLKLAGGSGTVSYDVGPVTFKSITAYNWLHKDYASDSDGTSYRILDSRVGSVTFRQFTQELQATGKVLDDRLNFAVGLFYYHAKGQDLQSAVALAAINPLNPATLNSGINNKSYAVYGQASYAIIDGLNLTLGARETHEKKILISRSTTGGVCAVPAPATNANCTGSFPTSYNNFSYTAGLDYQVTPAVLTYGKVSRGFKAGGTNQRTTTDPLSVTPFAPEILTSYEIGAKADLFDRHVRINVAAYYSDYSGIQLSTVVPNGSGGVTSIIANTDATGKSNKVRIKGAEAELVVKPIDEITLRGTYAYTDGYFVSGRPAGNVNNLLPNNPKHQASGTIAYDTPTGFGAFRANLTYSYRSKVEFQTTNHQAIPSPETPVSLAEQKSYGLLDARVTLHIDNGDFDVSAFGKNLTQEYYKVGALDLTGPGLGYVVGYYGQPRTFGLEFSKKL